MQSGRRVAFKKYYLKNLSGWNLDRILRFTPYSRGDFNLSKCCKNYFIRHFALVRILNMTAQNFDKQQSLHNEHATDSFGSSLGRLKDKVLNSKLTRALAMMVPLAGVGFSGHVIGEYADWPGIFSGRCEAGRTKNSISAVIAGIVGQKLHGDSVIDLEVQKICFPDASLKGRTTQETIDTIVQLASTSAHFTSKISSDGKFEGDVDKSEFDWNVRQSSVNSWEIARFGPKFDTTLKLEIRDGKISGVYERPGLAFDWDISGSYDDSGNVEIVIDAPLTLSVTLSGTIRPAN